MGEHITEELCRLWGHFPSVPFWSSAAVLQAMPAAKPQSTIKVTACAPITELYQEVGLKISGLDADEVGGTFFVRMCVRACVDRRQSEE